MKHEGRDFDGASSRRRRLNRGPWAVPLPPLQTLMGYFESVSSGKASLAVGMTISPPSRRVFSGLQLEDESAKGPRSDLYSALVSGQGRRNDEERRLQKRDACALFDS